MQAGGNTRGCIDQKGCPTAKGNRETSGVGLGRAREGTVLRIIAGEQGPVPLKGYESENLNRRWGKGRGKG